MKVAFIDRDGTIINDYEDEKWRHITHPEFIDGPLQALKEIRKKDFEIIVITNQYIINEGIITLLQYNSFTDKLTKELNNNGVDILDIFYCPHSRKENCDCIKPKTGLVEMALKKYPDIELNKSFIIGDSLCDVELGNSLGIMTFGINVETQLLNYIQVQSLLDIIKYL